MKKKLAMWQLIKDSLESEIPVMLLYVLDSKGSSPGRQGFSMAVTAQGKMEGSIGGGIMEHKFVEMAKDKLRQGSTNMPDGVVKKQIHDKSATINQSGMICSGEQTVLIYPIKQGELITIESIIASLSNNGNGTLGLSPSGISFSDSIPEQPFSFSLKDEDDWMYRERIGYANHLYIIGGGHCAFALSRLMCTMDFYIHLFDDRKDLLTMQQNEFAHEKKVIADYTELASIIPPGKNNYIVVMTFGYRTDDTAVRALLGKDFFYFGLMGSKKKIEKMFADYRDEDIEEHLLKAIHAPIGIPIKSETPEEIAVSIAAEIIQVKNRFDK